jgi:hypothetical protein
MRFGLALALLLGVLAALYLPRAFAQLAHQLERHVQPGARDDKSNLVHSGKEPIG